ncbi:MAG: efflux RND transporter permease subunit [Dehalococcoidia bacterium]|nr:efflux RND transporter permease subunit [Dehalococcoidia bacterium]
MNPFAWASRRPTAILLVAALLIALGAYLAFRIPRHDAPSVAAPRVVITTLSPQTTLEDMRDHVTLPQERTLADLNGLARLRSATRTGESILVAEFATGADLERLRIEVSARVSRVPLPADAASLEVSAEPSSLSQQPLVLLALTSPDGGKDLEDLAGAARKALLPTLQSSADVRLVRILGEDHPQVIVELNPEQLRAANISYDQVSALIRFNNVAVATGRLRAHDQDLPVVTFNEPATVQALENLVVGLAQPNPFAQPVPVRLKDVAKVSVSSNDAAGLFRVDGHPAVAVQVFGHAGKDPIQAAKAVSSLADEVSAALDPGIALVTIHDGAQATSRAIAGLEWLMLIGSLAALGLVGLLLFSLRATLVAAISLAAAVSIGIVLAYLARLPLTPLSGAGFALAIVFALPPIALSVEAAWRHARDGEPPHGAPWTAARDMALVIPAVGILALLGLLPLAFLSGGSGPIVRPLLLPIAATALAAILVALFLAPALAQLMLSWARPGKPHGPGLWLASVSVGLFRLGTAHPVAALIVGVAAFGASFALLPPLARAWLPQGTQDQAAVELFASPGATQPQKSRAVQAAERAVYGVDSVASVATITGHAQRSLGASFNRDPLRQTPEATLVVTFAGHSSPRALANELGEPLAAIAGISYAIAPIGIAPDATSFQATVLADSPRAAREAALALSKELAETAGVEDLVVSPGAEQTMITVEVDPALAMEARMGALQVSQQVTQMLGGQRITQVRLNGGEPADVLLKMDPAFVDNLEKLRGLPVGVTQPIPLTGVAAVERTNAPAETLREDGRYAAVVTGPLLARPQARLTESVVQVVSDFQATSSTQVRLTGLPQAQRDAFRWLYPGPAIAAVLVLAGAAVFLGSLRAALPAVVGALLASLGALAALVAFGRPLDLPAFAGLVLLPGLAAGRAIVLSGAVKRLRSRGLPAHQALQDAARHASGALIIATWPAVFALLPMAVGFLATGYIGSETAGVLAGGLVSASLLGAACVPAAYAIANGVTQARSRPVPAAPTAPPQAPSAPPPKNL